MPVQVRFNDVDRFGHVNNTAYFSLYDLGKVEYMHAVLGGGFEQADVVPVVANVNADFIRPIFYGDPIEMLCPLRFTILTATDSVFGGYTAFSVYILMPKVSVYIGWVK